MSNESTATQTLVNVYRNIEVLALEAQPAVT